MADADDVKEPPPEDDTGDAGSLKALEGVRFLRRFQPLLARLSNEACGRDRAGNRTLFYDNVCSLILLTFFNPTLVSLQDLRKASALKQVRKKLGVNETSMASLSEAMQVFDADRLVEIIEDLLGQIPNSAAADPRLKALAHVPTAVDGTLLRQLPQVTQACFSRRRDRGWKLHTHFEVLRCLPTKAKVTDGSGKGDAGEKAVLRNSIQSDHCYITDRNYEDFRLFNDIVNADSSYVCRVKKEHHFTVEETRELTAEAKAAGVVEDSIGRMGSPNSTRIEHPDHQQRRIVVKVVEHPKRSGRRRKPGTQELVIVTSLLDVPAEVIVLLYRFRWLIELFFRWLKCVLRCRHLLSKSANGIQIQMYCAVIACLMIQLASGSDVRPSQWTYKLLCLYAQGWATEEEVLEHLRERAALANSEK